MDVFIRVDASFEIGQGHVMRCLTLASSLKEQGLTSTFICREHPGNLCDFIEGHGYAVNRLPATKLSLSSDEEAHHNSWLGTTWIEDAAQTTSVIAKASGFPKWLVVDHYALDVLWESSLRAIIKRIMVIDDLADRPHDADLLLDQNLFLDMGGRYKDLVKVNCTQLLGPNYALLRQEFMDARINLRWRDGFIRRILIFFGGSDPTDETSKALDAIAFLNMPNVAIDIVVGATNPRKEYLAKRCAGLPNVLIHNQVNYMGALMANADLSLGAGGSATWERCATGLPSLVISVADNQVSIAEGVDRMKAHRYLGTSSKVTARILAAAIIEMQKNPVALQEMSKAALTLVDGYGVGRVAASLKDIS